MVDMTRLVNQCVLYIHNRVPSKSVSKTPYKLLTSRISSLRHFCVWSCKDEVKHYNPKQKKLDIKTVGGFFIRYNVGSKGYRFYYPSHYTRVIEFDRAIFFEDDLDSGVSTPRLLTLEEDCTFLLIPIVPFPNEGVILVIQNNDQVVVPQIDEHAQTDIICQMINLDLEGG